MDHRAILAEELDRDNCRDLAALVRSGDDGYSTSAALRAMARITSAEKSIACRLADLFDQASLIVIDDFVVSPGDRREIIIALRQRDARR